MAGQRQASNEQAQAQAEMMNHPMNMVQNQQGKLELELFENVRSSDTLIDLLLINKV